MRPVLLILVLVTVAECGKIKSEFLNPENISPQERVVKSKHLDSWSFGFGIALMLWKTMLEILRRSSDKHWVQSRTSLLILNLIFKILSIYSRYLGFYSNYYRQNSIQDEFEKTTSNNSDNPQARLFLGPNEVELGLGLVQDYIKNKPGLREIGEDNP